MRQQLYVDYTVERKKKGLETYFEDLEKTFRCQQRINTTRQAKNTQNIHLLKCKSIINTFTYLFKSDNLKK